MGDSVAKPIVPFFRLGLVLILALIAAAFLAWLQQPATTKVQSVMMIPQPPDTDRALQRVDPRRLRSSFQRGTAAMQKYIDDEPIDEGSNNEQIIKGAALVNIAAILGYEPARALIARGLPEIAYHPHSSISE